MTLLRVLLSPSMVLSSVAFLAVTVAFYFSDSLGLQYTQTHRPDVHLQDVIANPALTSDAIPFSTRAHWMRRANSVLAELSSPCPFAAFGSVVVNHTDTHGLGDLVCIGLNSMSEYGNPTLHGEIAAINNCSSILTHPSGRYHLSGKEALNAYKDLSLYTNGEPCPMCASAIRWAGFRECIYGTTIDTLTSKGWGQIHVSSQEIFQQSSHLPGQARLIKAILTNETDPYFSWQFVASSPCPSGCTRDAGGICAPL